MGQSNTAREVVTLQPAAVVHMKAADQDTEAAADRLNNCRLVDTGVVVAAVNDGASRLPIRPVDQRQRMKQDGLRKHEVGRTAPKSDRDHSNFPVDVHSQGLAGAVRCFPNFRIVHAQRIDIVVRPY